MNETIESINQWANETFGPCTSYTAMMRAATEMDEYLNAMCYDIEEAADVVITLYRIPGIQEAINKKMAINRGRKWKVNNDGTGQHIKEGGDEQNGHKEAR